MTLRTTRKQGAIGSTFDDFLKEDGTYEATQAVAIKRVLAWQIEQAMKDQRLTKAEMARRMATSRSQLDRLLDRASDSATLTTLARAARAVGGRLEVELKLPHTRKESEMATASSYHPPARLYPEREVLCAAAGRSTRGTGPGEHGPH